MILKLKLMILKLLIWSPIFNINLDDNYGRFSIKNLSEVIKNIRISLISINFGIWILYFFTYSRKEKKFKIFHLITLKEILKLRNYNKEKIEEYKKIIGKETRENLSYCKEFLEKKIERYIRRNSRQDIKVAIYLTITTIIISKTFYYIKGDSHNIFLNFLLIYIIYQSLGIIFLILSFYKRRYYREPRFSNFKKNHNKKQEIYLTQYRENLYLQNDTEKVTYTIQIEEKLKIVMYVIVIIFLGIIVINILKFF